MIRNIIFDIGGVLVDWNPHYYFDAYFNGDTEREEYFLKEICGREINVWMDGGMLPVEAGAKRAAQFPEWATEINEYIVTWKDQLKDEIPGMRECLQGLKASGYRLFGLTNWSDYTFRHARKSYPVLRELEDIVVSGAVHLLKPGPEIYRFLLEKNGLKASECVFVDDHIENVVGAQNAGIKGLLFTGKEKLLEDLKELTKSTENEN